LKKIRLSLILIMTALILSSCGKPTETPEKEKKNEIEEQTGADNPELIKIKLVPEYNWTAETKDENSFQGYAAIADFLASDYKRTVSIGDILTIHIKGKINSNIKKVNGSDNRYLTVQMMDTTSDWKVLGDSRPLRFDENGNIDETVKYKFFENNHKIENPKNCQLYLKAYSNVVYNPEGFLELEIEPVSYENDQIERVERIETTEDYILTFEENFNGTELDTEKWRRSFQLERQGLGGYWDDECSYVENGNLVIECRKNPVTGRYESGAVETDGLFEQCGGKYEIRFKIDNGQGWWYAFWLMNMTEMNVNNSATDGCEIDILEMIPHEKYIQTSFNWDGYPKDNSIKQAYYERWDFDENFFNSWHTATYYWMEDGYKLVMDGDEKTALVIPASKTGGVNHSANFILITAEFGDWYGSLWDKNPKIKDEMLPARMLVDYVKVWKGGNEPIEKKETKYTLKKDYKWDTSTNAPSTTEYDNIGIKLDLTDSYEQLPSAGDTVSAEYKFVSNKNIPDLYFYYVDTSSAENNYWLKLDGDYGTQGHISNITAGTEFTLSYNPTLTTSPEGNITLWIYYSKTVLDEEVILTVK